MCAQFRTGKGDLGKVVLAHMFESGLGTKADAETALGLYEEARQDAKDHDYARMCVERLQKVALSACCVSFV